MSDERHFYLTVPGDMWDSVQPGTELYLIRWDSRSQRLGVIDDVEQYDAPHGLIHVRIIPRGPS